MPEVLVEVRDLVQEFAVRGAAGRAGVVQAVSGVSFDVRHGETLGLVGETGSGKSTVARSLLMAPPPKSGTVRFRGAEVTGADRQSLLHLRRNVQMVFQDPYDSLDPKWTVKDIVREPLLAHRAGTTREQWQRVAELLELVGLDIGTYGDRRPWQLSGGQCQRVAIARALALAPALIVCDEPVSSLDVLIQAQILNLLEELRRELGLSYLFIAHDLALVKQVSDRVAVMYLGKIVEIGPSTALYEQPLHPYTAALLASIPSLDPDAPHVLPASTISGETPSALAPPSGCRFRTRCPFAQEQCATQAPPLRELAPDHFAACHFPLSGTAQAVLDYAEAAGV